MLEFPAAAGSLRRLTVVVRFGRVVAYGKLIFAVNL
jgi:hypothetical protein